MEAQRHKHNAMRRIQTHIRLNWKFAQRVRNYKIKLHKKKCSTMSNKGYRKPNYIAASPPTSRSPRVSTSVHTKDLVIIAKGKSQRREQTQRERVS